MILGFCYCANNLSPSRDDKQLVRVFWRPFCQSIGRLIGWSFTHWLSDQLDSVLSVNARLSPNFIEFPQDCVPKKCPKPKKASCGLCHEKYMHTDECHCCEEKCVRKACNPPLKPNCEKGSCVSIGVSLHLPVPY